MGPLDPSLVDKMLEEGRVKRARSGLIKVAFSWPDSFGV